jgi:hypothetical protein
MVQKEMKSKFFIIIGVILISIILNYLYSQIVISQPEDKFLEYRKMAHLKGRRLRLDFDLPQDTYFLKLKHIIKEDLSKEIFVNGFQVAPDIYHYIRRRGIIETSYIHLPKEIIKEGRNTIEIQFLKNRPPDVDVILSNYRKQIGNDIYILFANAKNLPLGKISLKRIILIIFTISIIFTGAIYFLSRILSLSINRLFVYQLYSFLPFIIFLSFLCLGSNLSKLYRIVISPSFFWKFGITSFSFTQGIIVLRKLILGYRGKAPLIINPQMNIIVNRVFGWIKFKEFSDKCILTFMGLLILCALLLIFHLEPFAEQLANIAYFALVIGVGIKFVKFIKEERQGKD